MPLTTEQIQKSFNEMVLEILKEGPMPFTKADIKDAVNATEIWIEANKISFNNALPVNFKTTASPQMKAILLSFVALRKAGR
jgi:hypothetical protein